MKFAKAGTGRLYRLAVKADFVRDRTIFAIARKA